MRRILFFALLLTLSTRIQATEPLTESAKGIYFLGTPERGKTQKNLGVGDIKGTPVVGLTDCKKGCPVAVYQYQVKESQETDKTVYFGSGLYLIEYDAESFIVVMPTGKLGHKPWTSFRYANIYSKNAQTAKGTSKAEIENYAKQISAKLFDQPVGKMAHAGGNYFVAVPQAHLGKSRREYQINFKTEGKKQITVKPCDRCPVKTYELLPKETAIIGNDVYRFASSDYIFDLKDGVLVYTFSNNGGLGKREWGKSNHYNVYASNEKYIRQLITNKQKQKAIDETLAGYFHDIKAAFDKEAEEKRQQATENRTLPKAGYQNPTQQKAAIDASKRWASAWNWKETIQSAYFTSNNWRTTRNPLTGIITGRVIRGVVTMKHPDGRCRFQYTSYREDYDGTQYFNLNMTGVGPIYDIKCDKLN